MSCCEKYSIDCREGRDCPDRQELATDRIEAALARIQVWVAWAAVGALVVAFWLIVWCILGVAA